MELFSTECNEIFAALAKAQGSFLPVGKSGVNPHFKSRYSTLEDIEKACRSSLDKNGLGNTHLLIESDTPQLITLLTHSSGQWMRSCVALKPASWEAQKVGGYITYMRRYALSALLGIVGGEDDDGESEREIHAKKADAPEAKQFINSSQLSQIQNTLRNRFTDDEDLDVAHTGILKILNVSRLADIKACDYKDAMKIINTLNGD